MDECEVCGEIATHFVNDVFRKADWKTGCWDCEIAGSHYFCEKHKRDSVERDISTSPLNS